jgi:hypothetical protein
VDTVFHNVLMKDVRALPDPFFPCLMNSMPSVVTHQPEFNVSMRLTNLWRSSPVRQDKSATIADKSVSTSYDMVVSQASPSTAMHGVSRMRSDMRWNVPKNGEPPRVHHDRPLRASSLVAIT